uniref:C3H1-type domain-containing protein n=1 Tax=Meloidogyne floridensis TaxID=298350 RepID=A0A915P8D0_9BILA
MIESLRLFRSVCNSRWFYNTAMILFLNKKDIFEEKIKTTSIQCLFKNYMETSIANVEDTQNCSNTSNSSDEFELVCTQTFLDYIQEDALSIEVWGHKQPLDDEEEIEEKQQKENNYLNNFVEQKMETLQERWKEVTKRLVKQTTESINDLEGRHWSFDGNINTTNILGQKESSGPKNPELYKTQWCRNILVKGNCSFEDKCWFVHDSSELRNVPQLNKTINVPPLFNLSSSALYNRRIGRF